MRPRDGGGPGSCSNGGSSWQFKVDGIYAGSTGGMTLAEIKGLIEPIQPARVAAAGAAYQRAGTKLAELAANLIDHAPKLAGAWGGAAAPKDLAPMKQLHANA